MTLRNTSKKYTKEEMEKSTETLLQISNNPTISGLKSILERNKSKGHKHGPTSNQDDDYDYGF